MVLHKALRSWVREVPCVAKQPPVEQDYRYPLTALNDHWSECTACSLGVSRQQAGGAFVFGEGSDRGVLVVGEGPGRAEEVEGRPFMGESGAFLRDILKELKFNRYYLTNAVACRSWDFQYDNSGNKRMRKNRRTGKEMPVIRDEPPKNPHIEACRDRLHQQIYALDPILIITLGGQAGEAVMRRPLKMQTECGTMLMADIPGAAHVPQLTPKGNWARKVRRQLIAPSVRNMVSYPVVPVVHPGFALAHQKDKRKGSPMNLFVTGLQNARNYYAAYVQEVFGEKSDTYELTEDAVTAAMEEEQYGNHY